jgi:antitoxin component HigA of HigAB toxin-antitoxin module
MKMTPTDIAYRDLLLEDLPHAIHNDRDYRKYLARIEGLLDKKNRSAAEDRYVELLAILIECYEKEHYPIEAPTLAEAVAAIRAEHSVSLSGISVRELIDEGRR